MLKELVHHAKVPEYQQSGPARPGPCQRLAPSLQLILNEIIEQGAPDMLENLTPFLLHWGITALSLWVASHIFSGLKFDNTSSLIVSALLLGFANAIVKPLLIVLTLPLTLLTFGLFILVINALMILLVAWLVKGFRVSSFWTAFFASVFIGLLSIVFGSFVPSGSPESTIQMPHGSTWL